MIKIKFSTICLTTVFLAFLLSGACNGAYAQKGKRGQRTEPLSLEEIAENKLPAGIIKRIKTTPPWDESNLMQPKATPPFVSIAAEKLGCAPEQIKNLTQSPNGAAVAFTYLNNLYVIDSEEVRQLTVDGSDVILNGYASWVYYEEILGRSSKYCAFWWSPDSKTIAFYRFDDSNVPMFPIYDPSEAKDQILATHYPMSGEKNPEVSVCFVDVDGGEITRADFDSSIDQYFGIPFWSEDGERFIVPWMPRVQQDLKFYSVNRADGYKSEIYSEHQETWIDWPEQMLFTSEGFYMVRDFTLWEQIYFLSFDGKTLRQLTSGKNWNINMLCVNEEAGEIYFTAKREKSTRTDIYKVSTAGGGDVIRLSEGEYSYSRVSVSEDHKEIFALRSNAREPIQSVLIPTDGSGEITILEDSKGEDFDKYEIALPQMLSLTTDDGYEIPAKITLPIGFDPSKKYPVLIYIYGGPNTPVVADEWSNPSLSNQWWAYQDVIQFAMDHRGSGHCGKEGCNFMFENFFDIELKDFEEWGRYLQELPYVDRDKIGIYGFSYGGSMATLCVTEGCDYFKYGIAGGGVYDYMLYDTHYTERYMNTPQNNPEGYARTVMLERIKASDYKGDASNFLLLTHGAADDNVHIQNTMSLVLGLQNMGRQFGLMIYPKQLHGYRGSQGKFSSMQDYRFWYHYLLGKEEVPQELRRALLK